MDAFSDPAIETVVVMSSAQVGKTETVNNVIGYFIEQDPSPILTVQPTVDMGKAWSKDRLAPMLRDTPCLKGKVKDVRSRDAENTVLHKRFPGGHITVSGANSAASLASRPIRIVLCDEISRYPDSAGTEGRPTTLAVKRTTTFYNRKIGFFSTPTVEGCEIGELYEGSDKRKYWVPCPHCATFMVLKWKQVVWPDGRPDLAVYVCEHCGGEIVDADKMRMIQDGEWRAEADLVKTAGFWINELYSPWVTFAGMAQGWVKAQDSLELLQVFINTSLGEVWKQTVVKASEEVILKARCALAPQTAPAGAAALTCGIDVQKGGFYFCVRAWARDYTSWLIHYGFLPTWGDVEGLLFDSAYPVEGSGQTMRMWRAAIDIGGGSLDEGVSMTEDTYFWLIGNQGRGCLVWGAKGSSHTMAQRFRISEPLLKTPSGRALPGFFRIVIIDTEKSKDAYHYHLGRAVEGLDRGAYLHSETGKDYAAHVLAEEKRTGKNGVTEWVQVKKDNHLFDADLLSMACAHPEWVGGGVNLVPMGGAGGPPPRREPEGGFVGKHGGWNQRRGNWNRR